MKDRAQQAAGVFLRYHHLVLGVAFQAAPMPGMAEDITQDVFMEFVTHADRWDYDRDIGQLLVGITRNIALRYWRDQKKRTSPKVFEVYEQLKTVLEAEERNHESTEGMLKAMNLCIEKLAPKSKEMILGHYRDMNSMQSIASIMQKSVNSVRLDLFRIRKVLRQCIRQILAKN